MARSQAGELEKLEAEWMLRAMVDGDLDLAIWVFFPKYPGNNRINHISVTHCFCCQLYHEVVKRQSHEISRLLRSSLLMRQEDVEEFLPKKLMIFRIFRTSFGKENSQNLNFPPIDQATFPNRWTGFGEQPGRNQPPQLLKAGKLLFLVDLFPRVFSDFANRSFSWPVGLELQRLDILEAMTSILWGDVFLHGKMKANLVASLVGFTTRKNGWDLFSGWKWWLMGKGVFLLPTNLEKSSYGASKLGSCEDKQKIIQHFLLTLQNFFYLLYFLSVFFGSRLFFTKLLAFLFAEVPDQKFFQRCLDLADVVDSGPGFL